MDKGQFCPIRDHGLVSLVRQTQLLAFEEKKKKNKKNNKNRRAGYPQCEKEPERPAKVAAPAGREQGEWRSVLL